jgi:hypothetical protein
MSEASRAILQKAPSERGTDLCGCSVVLYPVIWTFNRRRDGLAEPHPLEALKPPASNLGGRTAMCN